MCRNINSLYHHVCSRNTQYYLHCQTKGGIDTCDINHDSSCAI